MGIKETSEVLRQMYSELLQRSVTVPGWGKFDEEDIPQINEKEEIEEFRKSEAEFKLRERIEQLNKEIERRQNEETMSAYGQEHRDIGMEYGSTLTAKMGPEQRQPEIERLVSALGLEMEELYKAIGLIESRVSCAMRGGDDPSEMAMAIPQEPIDTELGSRLNSILEALRGRRQYLTNIASRIEL